MKILNLFRMSSVIIMTLVMVSCFKTENDKVEYLPFQETTDGQWGMISMDGKVLFPEEFKNKPTIVRDGHFFVRNNNGFWEMYDASEKPKKVGVDYAHTSGFRNGKALVSEKGKPVSIINTEGKTIKVLDKVEGKTVNGIRAYNNGYAVFMTEDSLFGAIDVDGNCVVKPVYCSLNNAGDDKFIGVNMKYKEHVKKDNKDKVKITVLDKKGKMLFDFIGNKYENIRGSFQDGLLAVSVKKDAKEIWGLIDDKGDFVVKPSAKIKDIGGIHGNKFTYNNGEGWGLMDTKGEILIRAKYESLFYDQDGILIATVKDGDTYEYKFIDEKDNQIGDETFVRATLFSMYDGEHSLVKPNDNTYSIIDKKGKQIEGLPDIVEVGTYDGEYYVESDFVDLNKMLKAFNISPDGVMGVTFKTLPEEAVKRQMELGSAYGSKEHPAGSPYWYDATKSITFSDTKEGVRSAVGINYSDPLSRQTYRTKQVIDYTFGDWYYYHNDKIPTGYVWNTCTPQSLTFYVANMGRMHGKLRVFYNVLYGKFSKAGKVVKKNNSAAVIELADGHKAVVRMEKDNVLVTWGNLKPTDEIDIDEYKDSSEEYDTSSISYGYLNELFPDKELTVEEMAVDDYDSVAVEEVVN